VRRRRRQQRGRRSGGNRDGKAWRLFLIALGFETPNRVPTTAAGVIKLYKEYSDTKRAKLDYEIDGLVISCNPIRTRALLGELGGRPRAAVALKFASQTET
jgi:NAD-dependent DNA ligase